MIFSYKYFYVLFLILICGGTINSQYLIRGSVYFSDNLSPVTDGKVYIIQYDYNLSIANYIDSIDTDIYGNYNLQTFFSDSVMICVSERQPITNEDHVITYYPSTIDWTKAKAIFPPDNPVNINISVQRIIHSDTANQISGTISTIDSNNNQIPLAGAVVVAKQDNIFTSSAITDIEGHYSLDSLSNGTATILSTKIGYELDSTNIIVGGNSFNLSNIKLEKFKNNIYYNSKNKKIIEEFILKQNYPNPFNPTTNISFVIKELGLITLIIYDLLGRQIAILVNEVLRPGNYEVRWVGFKYSSGIYFYELKSNRFKEVKIMNLIK